MSEQFVAIAPVWGLSAIEQVELEKDSKWVFPTPPLPSRIFQLVKRTISMEAKTGGVDLEIVDYDLRTKARTGAILGLLGLNPEMLDSFARAGIGPEVLMRVLVIDPVMALRDSSSLRPPEVIASEMLIEENQGNRKSLLSQLVFSCLRSEDKQLFEEIWCEALASEGREQEAIRKAKEDPEFIRVMGELIWEFDEWDHVFSDRDLPQLRNDVNHLRTIVSSCLGTGTLSVSYEQHFHHHHSFGFDGRRLQRERDDAYFLSNASYVTVINEEEENKARESAEADIAQFLRRCRVFRAYEIRAPFYFLLDHEGNGEAIWPDEKLKQLDLRRSGEDHSLPSYFDEYWQRFSQVLKKCRDTKDKKGVRERIPLALEAFHETFSIHSAPWRIVALVRCLEGLVMEEDEAKTEMATKTSQRVGWILDSSKYPFRHIEPKLKKEAYKVRNYFAHGQIRGPNSSQVPREDLVTDIEQYARLTLHAFMSVVLDDRDGPQGFVAVFNNLAHHLNDRTTLADFRERATSSFPFASGKQ